MTNEGNTRLPIDPWFRRVLSAGVSIQMTREIALEYRLRRGSLTDGTIIMPNGSLPHCALISKRVGSKQCPSQLHPRLPETLDRARNRSK